MGYKIRFTFKDGKRYTSMDKFKTKKEADSLLKKVKRASNVKSARIIKSNKKKK